MTTLLQSNRAEIHAENTTLKCRNHETWSVGDAAFQGDLLLVCIDMPKDAKARDNRQVATGDTKGSRHMVSGGEVLDVDGQKVADAVKKATNGKIAFDAKYAGPVFVGPCVLEHPQHQHQSFPEGSVVAVVFQRNADAEGRENKARD